MGHSQRLSLQAVRGVIRLVGEIRELGDDWRVWRLHLLTGLGQLVGAKAGVSCEHQGTASPLDAPDSQRGLVVQSLGGDAERRPLEAFMAAGIPGRHQPHRTVARQITSSFTRLRREAIDDRRWYDEAIVERVLRPAAIDDTIVSAVVLRQPGYVHALAVHRAWGEQAFEPRERQLVHLVHTELERLWQLRAQRPSDDPRTQLSLRLRQTLDRLLAGDSEKQIAHLLGVSQHTVHHYIGELYRRYGVASRGELLARHASGQRPLFLPRLTEE